MRFICHILFLFLVSREIIQGPGPEPALQQAETTGAEA